MAQGQVNARVGVRIQEILEAAAFAHSKSVGEVVRPAIEALAAELEQEPAVKTALRARKEAAAAAAGDLSHAEGAEPEEGAA
jgi:hypothetical protein